MVASKNRVIPAPGQAAAGDTSITYIGTVGVR